MDIAKDWEDYEILDMANGEKLERWGEYILVRPDPQIIWKEKQFADLWEKADAYYHRNKAGGGEWEYKTKLPEKWQIKYKCSESSEDSSKLVTEDSQGRSSRNKDLVFNIKPMSFKHTGLFPEQSVNWEFMINKIKNSKRDIKVLNLFAYTGGATVACLYADASVCHVDSSRGMIEFAKENLISSNLREKPVRFIIDDCIKFVNREIKRGNKYDAIIMDPPSFGRGANNEIWQFENNIADLVKLCKNVLSDNPLFFLINSYTTGISPVVLENILKLYITDKNVISGEIGLPNKDSNIILPCGIYARAEW